MITASEPALTRPYPAAACSDRIVQPLERRLLMSTTDNWIGTTGGDWDTASNWQYGVPTAGEDAVINLPGTAVITHSVNQVDSVNSVTSNQPITLSAGTLNVTTTMNLSGGSLTLAGGTLQGSTVSATGGAELVLTNSGGVLNGVTIPAGSVIDGTEANGAQANVVGGLVLNGTLELGGVYDGPGGNAYLDFQGPEAQTLSGTGTVVFGNGGSGNIAAQGNYGPAPETLTIASGITIDGGNGSIQGIYGPYTSGPATYSDEVVNDGTINANTSGYRITLGNSGTFVNNGTIEATAGGSLSVGNLSGNASSVVVTGSGSNVTLSGTYTLNQNQSVPAGTTLTLNGVWSNTAALALASGGKLYLGGSSMTLASIGTFTNAGGIVDLTGSLNNAGTTLALSSVTGAWNLQGGSITGGVITTSGAYDLVLTGSGGTLNGVTIPAGSVVDGTETNGAQANLVGGLVLNGTLELGGVYNGPGGNAYLYFQGPQAQTLSGTGTVVFGNGGSGNIEAQGNYGPAPETLTIASGITIDGGNGSIQGIYGPYTSGPATYSDEVVNDGTINASTSGYRITLGNSGTFVNNGTIEATAGGSVSIDQTVAFNGTSALAGYGTGTVTDSGNLIGNTSNGSVFDPLETVNLDGNGTATNPQLLEAMSAGVGKLATAYNGSNFVYGSLIVGGNNYVQLVNQSSNQLGGGPEAVYAVSVTVQSGSTLNLNGIDLYAGSTNVQPGGSVIGGIIELSPLPDAVAAVTGNGQPIVFNSSSTCTTNATSFGNELQNTGTYGQTYTIYNNGIATLDIGAVTVPTGFTLVSAPPSAIPAHASAAFTVGLTTGTPGTYGGDVSFVTNDSSHDPFQFEINGTVQMAAATADVTDTATGLQVPDGYAVPLTNLGTDLGITTQGGPTLASTFTITNTNNSSLSIGSIVLPYGFSLLSTPASTVAPGQATGFTLGLGTTVPGNYSGYVTFTTNDPYHDPYTFAITGTVIAVPAPITQLSYNGTVITDRSIGTDAAHGTNFGFVLQGGSPVVHAFTISNLGNATLNISSISLPSGFSLVGTPVTTIANNSSATFTFGLGTTNVGTFGGTVSFTTNDNNNDPFTFAVTGTVGLTNSPYIAVTPPNLQTTVAGQTSSFNLGSFIATNAPGPYKVTINWGDQSTPTVLTLPETGQVPWQIPSQTHTYTVSGSQTVTEVVVDPAGDTSNTATFTVNSVPAPATITLAGPSNQSASPGQATAILLGNFTETGAVGPYSVSVNWGDGTGQTSFSVGSSGPKQPPSANSPSPSAGRSCRRRLGRRPRTTH